MVKIVYQGCAYIGEYGLVRGGKAGNQTGGELRKGKWYLNERGWDVIRAHRPEVREAIARAMERAVANKHIGYDQGQRNTLIAAAKPHGYDPGLVDVDCETDCSALVHDCILFAGVPVGDFHTVNEPETLKATGEFDVLTDPLYTQHPDRLMRGDILCTPVSGHTVVILNDGAMAGVPLPVPEATTHPLLRLTSPDTTGPAVKQLQELLKSHGCEPGPIDGDFGPRTEAAVKKFQSQVHILDDGEVGPITWGKLLA